VTVDVEERQMNHHLLTEDELRSELGHVSLDGTKTKANASKHKAMSYGRMNEKEKELEHQVEELLRKAESVDAEEDQRYGKGIRGDELPEELKFREKRLAKIREAKKALEERIAKETEPSQKREASQAERPNQLHRSREQDHEGFGHQGVHPGLQCPGCG
jgi:primosomal protein N''